MWKDPSQLHGFDCATAPFHTNGNDAFCFSVTGERLPIFRSHCRVVHSCISLHTCVRGTGNGCWQHNGSMRMQYKSLIMPESWTAALKSTHHSAGTSASRKSRPCEVFWLYFWGISFVKSVQKKSSCPDIVCANILPTHIHKWDQIPLHWNHIPAMTPKMCHFLISQSLPVILNYKANQDDLNSKTQVAYESGHLRVNQNRGRKKSAVRQTRTSCRGLADLTRNIITSQGSPFMQISSLSLEVHY